LHTGGLGSDAGVYLQEIFRQHTAVFDAISNRAPDAAFEAMKHRIHYVLDFFRKQSVGAQVEDLPAKPLFS
jgi:DNA-binding FadR family transcriptional regulator